MPIQICCQTQVSNIPPTTHKYTSVYHLYHCRIGEIPPIICAMEDEDHLTDNELEQMRPRDRKSVV